METKHIYAKSTITLPVLEVVPLENETFEQAVVRVKRAQQLELENLQETECER